MDYKTSGVDVEAGRAFVDRIKSSVEKTHKSEVVGGLGGFGGCIRIPKGYDSPVLVSGTDGVGTKLELEKQKKLQLKKIQLFLLVFLLIHCSFVKVKIFKNIPGNLSKILN
jgi:phosphoribosylaminoimidazole (AIR) synthetase